MELTFFLTWTACLLSYSASINQKLLNKPTSKRLAWGGAIVCIGAAVMAASRWHIPATAFFYVLALMMTFWLVVIFMHGHITNKKLPLAISSVSLFFVILSAGGQYVA
jgi:hypothetical protein